MYMHTHIHLWLTLYLCVCEGVHTHAINSYFPAPSQQVQFQCKTSGLFLTFFFFMLVNTFSNSEKPGFHCLKYIVCLVIQLPRQSLLPPPPQLPSLCHLDFNILCQATPVPPHFSMGCLLRPVQVWHTSHSMFCLCRNVLFALPPHLVPGAFWILTYSLKLPLKMVMPIKISVTVYLFSHKVAYNPY